jgi:hypothetical protein
LYEEPLFLIMHSPKMEPRSDGISQYGNEGVYTNKSEKEGLGSEQRKRRESR